MLRKLPLTFAMILLVAASAFAAVVGPTSPAATVITPEISAMVPGDEAFSVDDFLALTPKAIRETTGKKLSLKETIALKFAQKKIKREIRRAEKGKSNSNDPDISKGLFIVLAIFVPIAAVIFFGLWDDWEGNTWWTALLLYALCYVPGLIYTLVKMKDYY